MKSKFQWKKEFDDLMSAEDSQHFLVTIYEYVFY